MKALRTILGVIASLPVWAFGGAAIHDLYADETAYAAPEPVELVVEQDQQTGGQFIYVVFHALDRDGFCKPPPGAVSLHPVLGIPVDFVIESGDGIIIETSSGPAAPGRSALGVPTFSTAENAKSASPVRAFPPLQDGIEDECQAWVRISQSIPGPLKVLVTVDGPEGRIGFIADATRTAAQAVTLSFRWTLLTWSGPDGVLPGDALKGTGAAAGGSDVSGQVTAIYGWEAAAQDWRGYFPAGAGVPGANDLAALEAGEAYWFAIKGPGSVEWQIAGTAD